jgi:hypothetical protein
MKRLFSDETSRNHHVVALSGWNVFGETAGVAAFDGAAFVLLAAHHLYACTRCKDSGMARSSEEGSPSARGTSVQTVQKFIGSQPAAEPNELHLVHG